MKDYTVISGESVVNMKTALEFLSNKVNKKLNASRAVGELEWKTVGGISMCVDARTHIACQAMARCQ